MRWKKVYPKGSRGVQTQPVQTAFIPGEQKPPRHDAVRIGAALALVLFGLIGVLSWFTTEGALMNGFRVVAAGLLGWGFYPIPLCLFLAAYWLGLHRDRPCTRKVVCTLVIAAMFGAFMHLAACSEDNLLRLGAMTDMTLTDVVLQLGKAGIGLESHCGGILSGFAAVLLYTCLRRVIGCIVLILAAVPVCVYAFGGDFRKLILEVLKLGQKLKAQQQAAQLAREHRMQEIAAAEEEAARRAQEEAACAAAEQPAPAAEPEAGADAAEKTETAPSPVSRRSLFDDDPDLADLLSDVTPANSAPAPETEGAEAPAEEVAEAEKPAEAEEPAEETPAEMEEPAEETPVDTEEPVEEEKPVKAEAPADETPAETEKLTAEESRVEHTEPAVQPMTLPEETAEEKSEAAPEFVRLDPENPDDFLPAPEVVPDPEPTPAPEPAPEPEPDPAALLMQSLHRRQESGTGSRRVYDEEWEEQKERLFSAADLLEDEPEQKTEEKHEDPAESSVPVEFVQESSADEIQPASEQNEASAEETAADEVAAAEESAPAEARAEEGEAKPEERRPRSSGRFEFIIMSNDPKPKRRTAKEIWDELDS